MADNYTFKDASGNTKTHASVEISPGIHASIHLANEAVQDNADAFIAGTNMIIPVSYFSKDAVELMTDGRTGTPRMSKRRVPLIALDVAEDALGDDAIQANTDIKTNTSDSISGATTPTTAWFTGSDAGFTAAARYIYIPMAPYWSVARIGIFDSLNAAVTYTLYGLTSSANDTTAISSAPVKLDECTLGANSGIFQSIHWGMLALGAAGAGDTPSTTGGAYYRQVAALALGWRYLAIKVLPNADPSSGVLRIRIYRASV